MASQTEAIQVILYLEDYDNTLNRWVVQDQQVVDQVGTVGSGSSCGGGSYSYVNLQGIEWTTFSLAECENKSQIRFRWAVKVTDTHSGAKASGGPNGGYGDHYAKWNSGTGVFMGGKK